MKTEIEKYHACREAVEYRKQFDTFEKAWNACERGDWMLRFLNKVVVNNKSECWNWIGSRTPTGYGLTLRLRNVAL